jgi:hypothetical protein
MSEISVRPGTCLVVLVSESVGGRGTSQRRSRRRLSGHPGHRQVRAAVISDSIPSFLPLAPLFSTGFFCGRTSESDGKEAAFAKKERKSAG